MTTFSHADRTRSSAAENSIVTATTVECQRTDETFDTLFEGNLQLIQSRTGYRVSLDALLLASFATIRPEEEIADLGSGNGVIPLILAYLYSSVLVTGVEFQVAMADRARRNVQLNGFEERVRIAHGDVRAIKRVAGPESFDAVVCNPPYRQPSSGRISPNKEKQVARHECAGGLGDFIAAGAYLLPAKGRMALIYPAVRSIDLLGTMRHVGIEPKRVRMVHSFAETEASLVLVEGVKGGRSGVKVHAPLRVFERAREYTVEIKAMLTGAARNPGIA
jgi:tRNA1Val (adenine37-N6)-methyltransferase